MKYFWFVYQYDNEGLLELMIFSRHETGTLTLVYDDQMSEITCYNNNQEEDYSEWKKSCIAWGNGYYRIEEEGE